MIRSSGIRPGTRPAPNLENIDLLADLFALLAKTGRPRGDKKRHRWSLFVTFLTFSGDIATILAHLTFCFRQHYVDDSASGNGCDDPGRPPVRVDPMLPGYAKLERRERHSNVLTNPVFQVRPCEPLFGDLKFAFVARFAFFKRRTYRVHATIRVLDVQQATSSHDDPFSPDRSIPFADHDRHQRRRGP